MIFILDNATRRMTVSTPDGEYGRTLTVEETLALMREKGWQ